VEALLRWQDPKNGLVPPDKFIPLAEDTGLIFGIGEWVIRKALADKKAWTESGVSPVKTAVNISRAQLTHKGFVDTVAGILKETGADPQWLEFELTESVLMKDASLSKEILCGLKALGISISIDDFGIGYSSLERLKDMPIDKLKISRSFIRDITTDKNDAAVSKAIIGIAHGLDLNVVAVEVETEEQIDLLKGLSCDRIQGYYISKPLPPEEVREFLKEKGHPPTPPVA